MTHDAKIAQQNAQFAEREAMEKAEARALATIIDNRTKLRYKGLGLLNARAQYAPDGGNVRILEVGLDILKNDMLFASFYTVVE